MNKERLLFTIALLATCGNWFFALQSLNRSAVIGWTCALCWFPYKYIRNSKRLRKENKE